MPEYDIKISELNQVVPNPPFTEDFFPLVHSASMTTYRATLQDIGSLMTHSIYADTASYVLTTVQAASASHANYSDSASYATSASHAVIADSASYYPPQQFQTSCSWASQSLQSLYATNSLNVNLTGSQYYFPFWYTNKVNGWETNGCLYSDPSFPFGQSALYDYRRPDYVPANVIVAGPNPIFTPTQSRITNGYIGNRTDYDASSSWSPWANTLFGQFPFGGGGGFWSIYPIVSPMFVGTDQMSWNFKTASVYNGITYTNQFWSGSSYSGSINPVNLGWQTIPNTSNGISSSFNKKWVRIVCAGVIFSASYFITNGASKGETQTWDNTGLSGRVRLIVAESGNPSIRGSSQEIDMHITSRVLSGGTQVMVYSAISPDGYDIIRKIRISEWTPDPAMGKLTSLNDPLCAIDLYLDQIENGVDTLSIIAQSWGGIKFLQTLNVDPYFLVNTGSANPHNASYLIFPSAPGYYSTYTGKKDYQIQGQNVIINPTYNELTESYGAGTSVTLNSPYALQVSGTINASQGFYCDGNVGLTTKVTYGTTNLYFSGGLLIGKVPP